MRDPRWEMTAVTEKGGIQSEYDPPRTEPCIIHISAHNTWGDDAISNGTSRRFRGGTHSPKRAVTSAGPKRPHNRIGGHLIVLESAKKAVHLSVASIQSIREHDHRPVPTAA